MPALAINLEEISSASDLPELQAYKKQTNIIQNRPQKIILSDINLKSKFSDQGMYELTAEDVSVMDGFVDVDIEFSSH